MVRGSNREKDEGIYTPTSLVPVGSTNREWHQPGLKSTSLVPVLFSPGFVPRAGTKENLGRRKNARAAPSLVPGSGSWNQPGLIEYLHAPAQILFDKCLKVNSKSV